MRRYGKEVPGRWGPALDGLINTRGKAEAPLPEGARPCHQIPLDVLSLITCPTSWLPPTPTPFPQIETRNWLFIFYPSGSFFPFSYKNDWMSRKYGSPALSFMRMEGV